MGQEMVDIPSAVDGPVLLVPLLLYPGSLLPAGVKLVEPKQKGPHLLAQTTQDSLEEYNLVKEGVGDRWVGRMEEGGWGRGEDGGGGRMEEGEDGEGRMHK